MTFDPVGLRRAPGPAGRRRDPRPVRQRPLRGREGLYIHPGVWRRAFVPLDDRGEFLDRQGRMHARVSVDFAKTFGGYLSVPLSPASDVC